MLTEARNAFLMVRSDAYLASALTQSAALMSAMPRQAPEVGLISLSGIWINAESVSNLPNELHLPEGRGCTSEAWPIESIGISGIWVLCWTEAGRGVTSRADWVAALLKRLSQGDPPTPAARFIPVVQENRTDSDVNDELQALEKRFPHIVLPPVHIVAGGKRHRQSTRPVKQE